MNILYLSSTDLAGRRFNGFDLHRQFQEMGHQANIVVHTKKSDDDTTFINNYDMFAGDEDVFVGSGLGLTRRLVTSSQFLDADIVHIHLAYNHIFSIHHLPLVSRLKPVVWTLHDPWLMGGHCIYPGKCEKWRVHCHDCSLENDPYQMDVDETALLFESKRLAVHHANLDFIVASKWMLERTRQSPILEGKTVHEIPFGVDQTLFSPGDARAARRRLNIPEDDMVLFLRQQRHFKRPDIVHKALASLQSAHKNITILLVGSQDYFPPPADNMTVRSFGWVTDDELLADLYRACDLFLMPSDQEAFGVMAIEAMSCGRMVLVLEGTALPMVVNAPDCGLATTEEEYGAALRRVVFDPEELKIRGERSLAFARKQYNQETYHRRLISVYEEVIRKFKPKESANRIAQQLDKHSRHSLGSKQRADNLYPKTMLYVLHKR